jgi:hypothetical protein
VELPASPAASLEPAAEGNALSSEEKRLSKESSGLVTVTPKQPVKKLMLRSFIPQQLSEDRHAAAAAEADGVPL